MSWFRPRPTPGFRSTNRVSGSFPPAALARLLLLAAVLAVSACSSFDARWRAAEKAAGSDSPTRWDGRWTSAKHRALSGAPESGRLRAVFTSVKIATQCFPTTPRARAASETQIRADFHANWLFFASNFTTTLSPVPGSRTAFRGSQELPAIFGGTYRYTARLAGDHFTATYDSSYDRGRFDLTRVRP